MGWRLYIVLGFLFSFPSLRKGVLSLCELCIDYISVFFASMIFHSGVQLGVKTMIEFFLGWSFFTVMIRCFRYDISDPIWSYGEICFPV